MLRRWRSGIRWTLRSGISFGVEAFGVRADNLGSRVQGGGAPTGLRTTCCFAVA